MPIYIVAVDLDRISNNYTCLRKNLFNIHAMHAQGSVWFVRYDKGADALRDYLQNDLHHNDRLFVGELSSDWATFNMAPSSRWLSDAGAPGV